MSNLPSLAALRAFAAAARLGSFRAAAEELHVSPTAVSHHIRGLEAWLCLTLFTRSGRRVLLTDRGLQLAEEVAKAFQILEQACRAAANRPDQAPGKIFGKTPGKTQAKIKIRIAMGPSFATRWMLPRLSAFDAQFPGIALDLVQTPLLLSPQNVDADIFIAWGDGHWPDMIAHRLVDVMAAPVASPGLLDRLGHPARPEALLGFPLIHQRDTLGWSQWFAYRGIPVGQSLSGPVIEDTNVVLQAAIAGQGLVMGWRPLIDGELANRTLVQLFAAVRSEIRAYYLIRHRRDTRHGAIDAICSWLIGQSSLDRCSLNRCIPAKALKND